MSLKVERKKKNIRWGGKSIDHWIFKAFQKSGTNELSIKEVRDNISELLPSLKSEIYQGGWKDAVLNRMKISEKYECVSASEYRTSSSKIMCNTVWRLKNDNDGVQDAEQPLN